ncbi:hypothetical protein Ntsu_68520 [Nocardia sp. IFM 10818]
MCRHLGYLGPPASVGELLTRGPHSLRTQSWAPEDMRGGGTINADGFGVAWWTPAAPPDHGPGVTWHGGMRPAPADAQPPGEEPAGTSGGRWRDPTGAAGREEAATVAGAQPDSAAGAPPLAPMSASRYRNAEPIWTDPAVDEVLPQLRSTAVLAAIRSATVGMPVERAACAPFTHGRWAFSHNGAIPDWRHALTAVAVQFDSPSLLEAESLTDSAALWVILRGLLEGSDDAGVGRTETGVGDEPPPHGKHSAPGTSEPGREGAQSTGEGDAPPGASGFSATVSFGSAVSVSTTSGAQPQVTSWSWTTGEEVGATGEEDTTRTGRAAGEARIHGQSLVFGPGGATAWSWTVGDPEKGATGWGAAPGAAGSAGSGAGAPRGPGASGAPERDRRSRAPGQASGAASGSAGFGDANDPQQQERPVGAGAGQAFTSAAGDADAGARATGATESGSGTGASTRAETAGRDTGAGSTNVRGADPSRRQGGPVRPSAAAASGFAPGYTGREAAGEREGGVPGMAPDAALRAVVRAVLEQSPRARLNLLLGDGETLWATTVHHSLSVLVTEEFAVVASEPYDGDPRWRAIGDRQLVGVRPGWVSVEPLDIETGKASS